MRLRIIFQDSHLLVIDKPSGLVATPSETQTEPTLADILNSEYGVSLDRGGLVHRLDKDTSGVILAAKDLATFESLQAQFKSRQVKKEYICLVHGYLEGERQVNAPIIRNPGDREKFIVAQEGREAVTKFQVLLNLQMSEDKINQTFAGFNKVQMRKLLSSHYSEFSLLKALPETGRTHQIRVHLKYLGSPIVGDEKYGGRKTFRLDCRWCPRQFLHAARITFTHPVTGEVSTFDSSLPEDLKHALECLKKE